MAYSKYNITRNTPLIRRRTFGLDFSRTVRNKACCAVLREQQNIHYRYCSENSDTGISYYVVTMFKVLFCSVDLVRVYANAIDMFMTLGSLIGYESSKISIGALNVINVSIALA